MTVRPANADDIPSLVALEAGNSPTPWSERVFRDELDADNRVYLVADDEGVVGFGGVLVVGEEAHVTNLLVDPGRRRRGIGRRLMVALVTAAIGEGARHLTLEVRSSNDAARSLYTGLGLAPVGVRREYYGDDDALILWAHDIDSEQFRERLA